MGSGTLFYLPTKALNPPIMQQHGLLPVQTQPGCFKGTAVIGGRLGTTVYKQTTSVQAVTTTITHAQHTLSMLQINRLSVLGGTSGWQRRYLCHQFLDSQDSTMWSHDSGILLHLGRGIHPTLRSNPARRFPGSFPHTVSFN